MLGYLRKERKPNFSDLVRKVSRLLHKPTPVCSQAHASLARWKYCDRQSPWFTRQVAQELVMCHTRGIQLNRVCVAGARGSQPRTVPAMHHPALFLLEPTRMLVSAGSRINMSYRGLCRQTRCQQAPWRHGGCNRHWEGTLQKDSCRPQAYVGTPGASGNALLPFEQGF